MHNNQELCKKITTLYPDIGNCGIDIGVTFDNKQNYYVIDLKKGGHELKHYLPPADADLCMNGKQCVALGIEIAQLKKHLEGEPF